MQLNWTYINIHGLQNYNTLAEYICSLLVDSMMKRNGKQNSNKIVLGKNSEAFSG